MHFKRRNAFQMHKLIIFFQKKMSAYPTYNLQTCYPKHTYFYLPKPAGLELWFSEQRKRKTKVVHSELNRSNMVIYCHCCFCCCYCCGCCIDFELKKVLLPPLGNFADISYLEENFKPHLLRDVCTLCSGALVSDSLLHMLL